MPAAIPTGYRRWSCPTCNKFFAIKEGAPPPVACPSCRKSGEMPSEPPAELDEYAISQPEPPAFTPTPALDFRAAERDAADREEERVEASVSPRTGSTPSMRMDGIFLAIVRWGSLVGILSAILFGALIAINSQSAIHEILMVLVALIAIGLGIVYLLTMCVSALQAIRERLPTSEN